MTTVHWYRETIPFYSSLVYQCFYWKMYFLMAGKALNSKYSYKQNTHAHIWRERETYHFWSELSFPYDNRQVDLSIRYVCSKQCIGSKHHNLIIMWARFGYSLTGSKWNVFKITSFILNKKQNNRYLFRKREKNKHRQYEEAKSIWNSQKGNIFARLKQLFAACAQQIH